LSENSIINLIAVLGLALPPLGSHAWHVAQKQPRAPEHHRYVEAVDRWPNLARAGTFPPSDSPWLFELFTLYAFYTAVGCAPTF